MTRWKKGTRAGPWVYVALAVLTFAGAVALPLREVRAEIEYPDVHEVEADPAAYLGRTVSLVGRFDSLANGHMRLVNADMDVVLAAGARRPPGGVVHLRMTGRLRREGDGLRLDVTYLTTAPSEAETFATRRQETADDDVDALYALSRWARQRGDWYNDRQLQRLSAQAFREAFRAEENRIAVDGDAAALLAHADRGQQLGLEASEVNRLRHRALWMLMRDDRGQTDGLNGARLSRSEAEWQQVAAQIAELLPGADQPPAPPGPQPEAAYWNDPAGSYEAADGPMRRAMHRALWSEAMVRGYDASRNSDDHDAVALWEEARTMVPERVEWLNERELEALDARAARGGELSRNELEEIRASYASLGREDRADEVTRVWLKTQRDALAAGDADGRVRLAEAYRALSGDDRSAGVVCRGVGNRRICRRARRGANELGYRKILGRWRHPDELTEAERAEWEREQQGRIEPGDRERDVVRRFRRPDRVARTVTSSGLVEKWIYEGPPRLEIFLRRGASGGEAVVTAVATP
ncbi:MAG: hypothetical protein R3C10_01015 [Pirellulales bacterium]